MASARRVGGVVPVGVAVRRRATAGLHAHAARAPRSLQRHLGALGLGVECDRRVVAVVCATRDQPRQRP